jgi:putative phosphoesterase
MGFMRWCVETVKPDAMIHLGDFYDDGDELHEEYPNILLYQVAGNCDWYSAPPGAREILIMPVQGVNLYMTHGHRHYVKSGTDQLVRAALDAKVQAVLYGHTHVADCRKDGDLWILNPGAAGSWGGSAGIIEVENGKILNCRIFRYGEQEELK